MKLSKKIISGILVTMLATCTVFVVLPTEAKAESTTIVFDGTEGFDTEGAHEVVDGIEIKHGISQPPASLSDWIWFDDDADVKGWYYKAKMNTGNAFVEFNVDTSEWEGGEIALNFYPNSEYIDYLSLWGTLSEPSVKWGGSMPRNQIEVDLNGVGSRGDYTYYVLQSLTYSKRSEDPDPCPPAPAAPAAHEHNFQWRTITEPSAICDGVECEVCTVCGATGNSQPLSAMGYALEKYAEPMINAAKPGNTVTFEFGEWNSFPCWFMEKIAAKSMEGVSFVFHYNWNHEKQEITIPYATVVDTQFEWYGPAKMAELYGNIE